MFFLLAVKPGTTVGPFKKGGKRVELPKFYRGVDRFTLPIASQLKMNGFGNRLIPPSTGIGLKLFSQYEYAFEALKGLPDENKSPDDLATVEFSENLGREIYKRHNVEIIAIRGSDLRLRYPPNSAKNTDDVNWIGFDLYAEEGWSLIRESLSNQNAAESILEFGISRDTGLFQREREALNFLTYYDQLAKLRRVEPLSNGALSTEGLKVLCIEIGIPQRPRV